MGKNDIDRSQYHLICRMVLNKIMIRAATTHRRGYTEAPAWWGDPSVSMKVFVVEGDGPKLYWMASLTQYLP